MRAVFDRGGLFNCGGIRAATDHCVVIAFTAGNLPAVAKQIRAGKPDATIALCADDDFMNAVNIGVEKAREAARAFAGHVVKPELIELDGKATNDWNDLWCRESNDVVREQIVTAIADAVRKDAYLLGDLQHSNAGRVQLKHLLLAIRASQTGSTIGALSRRHKTAITSFSRRARQGSGRMNASARAAT